MYCSFTMLLYEIYWQEHLGVLPHSAKGRHFVYSSITQFLILWNLMQTDPLIRTLFIKGSDWVQQEFANHRLPKESDNSGYNRKNIHVYSTNTWFCSPVGSIEFCNTKPGKPMTAINLHQLWTTTNSHAMLLQHGMLIKFLAKRVLTSSSIYKLLHSRMACFLLPNLCQ